MLESAVAAIPENATVKGFYFTALLRESSQAGQYLDGYGPYRDFKDYPAAEVARLLAECAERMYPDQPKGEGLRRLGWVIFPTLLTTMVGKVVFGALGNDFNSVMQHAHRGFEVSLNTGRCSLEVLNERDGVLHVKDFYIFPQHFLVGVLEGAMAHYGHEGNVGLRLLGPGEGLFHLSW